MARQCLAWLARPDIALERATEAGILLAAAEIASDPLHLVVIGPRDDTDAISLFETIKKIPNWYKRIEWWDRAGKPLLNPDVDYPPLKRAAAFVCTQRRCSLPIYDSAGTGQFLRESPAQVKKEDPG